MVEMEEHEKCITRKVTLRRKDGTEETGYAIYCFDEGVITRDIFVKELTNSMT